MRNNTVSIIMPAHKESGNLRGAVRYVSDEIELLYEADKISDWEIIIIDSVEKDGSTDGTPQLADRLAKSNSRVKVIHNNSYVNLGYKYRQGLSVARFDYFMMVPGKNTLHGASIKNLLDNIPENGIVIGYQADMSRRPFKRRIISKCFTVFMNLVFGLRLRYYNGTTVIPTKILRELSPDTDNFAYMAEILVTLIKKYRLPYTQIPFYTKGIRTYGKTKATELQNIISVVRTILKLIVKIYFKKG
ncbi:MAG: glycosyltransferase family 2 protein [Patescibacteria group bacterium]